MLEMHAAAGAGHGQDVENPMAGEVNDDDFARISEEYSIGNAESFASQMNDSGGGTKVVDKMRLKNIVDARLNIFGKLLVLALVIPMSTFYLVMNLFTFVVLVTYNYTGINLYESLNMENDERETIIKDYAMQLRPVTLRKAMFFARKYMTYWVVIIVLILSANIGFYDVNYTHNSWLLYAGQVAFSVILGFVNLVPAKRPDISEYLSVFLEEDISISDSPHTRLKSVTDILQDLGKYGYLLLRTESGSPVVVTTMVPEELAENLEFISTLFTAPDTFDDNRILRYIQVEENISTFVVLRNDIAMCHMVEGRKGSFWYSCLDVSPFEMNLFGGASLVFLVSLLSLYKYVGLGNTLIALIVWAAWPLLYAFMFRVRKSKLASMAFFCLDGKSRVPVFFNAVAVSSDRVLLKKIIDLKFFQTFFKFTAQGKFAVHNLLKSLGHCKYNWIDEGIKVKDFRLFIQGAGQNVLRLHTAVVTNNSKVFFPVSQSRRYDETDLCVVFHVKIHNGEAVVLANQMVQGQFSKLFPYPNSRDVDEIEDFRLK